MRHLIPVLDASRRRPCNKTITYGVFCGKGPVVWESGELHFCLDHALEIERTTKNVQDHLRAVYEELKVVS